MINGSYQIVTLLEPLAVFLRNLKVRFYNLERRYSSETNNNRRINNAKLFTKISDALFVLLGLWVTVVRRTADGFGRLSPGAFAIMSV